MSEAEEITLLVNTAARLVAAGWSEASAVRSASTILELAVETHSQKSREAHSGRRGA